VLHGPRVLDVYVARHEGAEEQRSTESSVCAHQKFTLSDVVKMAGAGNCSFIERTFASAPSLAIISGSNILKSLFNQRYQLRADTVRYALLAPASHFFGMAARALTSRSLK